MFIIFLPHTNNISGTRLRDPCLTVEVFDSTTFQGRGDRIVQRLYFGIGLYCRRKLVHRCPVRS